MVGRVGVAPTMFLCVADLQSAALAARHTNPYMSQRPVGHLTVNWWTEKVSSLHPRVFQTRAQTA